MAANIVKHVVVDSGGFIKNAPLRDIGDNIITVPEVVSEIRDKATRERLQVLPYDLHFKQPQPEAIKAVSEFAKKTGDYRCLSAVDLRVMALTLQLEWEHVGREHIKTKPDTKVQWVTTNKHLDKPTDIAGFYLGSKKESSAANSRTVSQCGDGISELSSTLEQSSLEERNSGNSGDQASKLEMTAVTAKDEEVNKEDTARDGTETARDGTNMDRDETDAARDGTDTARDGTDTARDGTKTARDGTDTTRDGTEEGEYLPDRRDREGATISADLLQDEENEEDDDEEEDDDDDDEGWITPSNITQMKQAMGEVNCETAQVTVGCLTTDFSMQNVLIQMGLNVISVDGMLIKRARSFVQRCVQCMKVTTNVMKEFCPHCGNKTLQRVSMTVDDDGNIRYFLSRRKPISTRGMKYSLPLPKGGKHANNPILCEDQKEAQQRQAKASRIKYDVMDPDYICFNSPFAPIDTHSRSAQLGIRSHKNNFKKRANPNEGRKIYGRRKK